MVARVGIKYCQPVLNFWSLNGCCGLNHNRGVSMRSQTGGPSVINFGTLEQSWRMVPSPTPNPPPRRQFGAPEVVSSLEPLWGTPACAWMVPYSCWFIFFPSFFPLFPPFFFPFHFSFLAPLLWPGGAEVSKAPPGYAPAQPFSWVLML